MDFPLDFPASIVISPLKSDFLDFSGLLPIATETFKLL